MAAYKTLRLADLAKNRPHRVALDITNADLPALAQAVGADHLSKLRFEGVLSPKGRQDWVFQGDLGASAMMTCVVSGDPVAIRVDTPVTRTYSDTAFEGIEAGSELEMPEDDSVDPLPEVLDLMALAAEALTLALPDYPRTADARLDQTTFASDGVTPMSDEAAKPFAGLASLRDQLKTDD